MPSDPGCCCTAGRGQEGGVPDPDPLVNKSMGLGINLDRRGEGSQREKVKDRQLKSLELRK